MSATCHRRESCRLCGGKKLESALLLTPTPPANAFVRAEERDQPQACFPLELFFCTACTHLQLLDVVDPRLLFENYVYVSSTSPLFVQHFQDYANWLRDRYAPPENAQALDIGSNDGALLRFFQKAGLSVLGIDPAINIARQATESGIETRAAFFSEALAKEIRAERGPFHFVTGNNVFAHIDDLSDVTRGIRTLLSPEGVFSFEVSYLADVYEKTLFDTIYHEHLAYHAVKPLVSFFEQHGMTLIEAERVSSHGGSLRGVAQLSGGPHPIQPSVAQCLAEESRLGLDQLATYQDFAQRIETRKKELGSLLRRLKSEGKRIAGFGAPAKAATLTYHFDIGPDLLDFIVDDSPLKQGLFTPGTHIPVLSSDAIAEHKPDYLVILAWNFAQPIMDKQVAFREAGGRFITPLPDVQVF